MGTPTACANKVRGVARRSFGASTGDVFAVAVAVAVAEPNAAAVDWGKREDAEDREYAERASAMSLESGGANDKNRERLTETLSSSSNSLAEAVSDEEPEEEEEERTSSTSARESSKRARGMGLGDSPWRGSGARGDRWTAAAFSGLLCPTCPVDPLDGGVGSAGSPAAPVAVESEGSGFGVNSCKRIRRKFQNLASSRRPDIPATSALIQHNSSGGAPSRRYRSAKNSKCSSASCSKGGRMPTACSGSYASSRTFFCLRPTLSHAPEYSAFLG